MKRAVMAILLALSCHASSAAEPDLVRRVAESMPQGFSGPLHFSKRGTATTDIWMQLRPGTSCAVRLIEAAGKLELVKVDRSDEKNLLMRLTRDSQAEYQVVHVEEEPGEDLDGPLQSRWTGTKDWKDASETWRSIPKDRGLAFLAMHCVGNDSRERLDALRSALDGVVQQNR